MEKHFTYAIELDRKNLRQGDVLSKTGGLLELIKKVHPHYALDEYTHFQVLTQSCDLVRRRKNECKSRYISLAAVRGIDVVIKRLVEEIKNEDHIKIDGKSFCPDKYKRVLADSLRKIYNNNDKNLFFLKSSLEDGLKEDSCTFLHLSIAIRAYEHYDLCLSSKILELTENFQSKLGWLVGNLYSRVGTEDYVPGALPDNELFDNFIYETLESHVGWIPEKIYPYFRKEAKKGNNDIQNIREKSENIRERAAQSKLNNLVALIARSASLCEQQKISVRNSLAADPLIQRMISN